MTMTIIQSMTETEARQHVTAINSAAADMGRRLLELKEREGWRALGYPNWTALLQGEFSYSRQYLYELMHAAPVLERMSTTVDKLSTKAAAALARFDADLHPVIIKTAVARYGQLTESNVTRVGTVVQEMATTGHVDTGNGTSTPIDAALDAEDVEAQKRRKAYMSETDYLARLYLTYEGRRYRVKVLENTVGIERQPGGENCLLSKAEHLDTAGQVYDAETGAWDYAALGLLLRQYPNY